MILDQYFTEPEAADKLVQSLIHRLDPTCARHYIEPSCGKGAFVTALEHLGIPRRQIRSVEIDPNLPADFHQDFLQATRESLAILDCDPANTVVIGNPPFGRNGKMARQFINKAAEYANWICFIVPRSMHGAHGCDSLNPRLDLIYERLLPNSFITTKAKCNWQEWVLLPEGCTGYRPKEAEPDTKGLYEIVSYGDRYNIVIQRCGGSAGKITRCNGTGEGKYYIRSQYPEVLQAFHNLPRHKEADLTTHQNSLSARMLHELLEQSLLNQYVSQIRNGA
jgi:predicted RNA methylase